MDVGPLIADRLLNGRENQRSSRHATQPGRRLSFVA